MFECTTCKKVLKKESALVQHCKDKGHPYVAPVAKATPVRTRASTASLPTTSAVASSTAAVASSSTAKVLIECALCSTSFNDKTSYDQHVASKHPPKPFKCAPCGVEFSSAEALSIHYKHFAVHPKCPQCGSAFIDSTQLKLHQAIHPKCSQCGSIFLNRAHLEEHAIVAHPIFRCSPCGRDFASVADRNRHYSVSPTHPNCFVCREGFADDSEMDKHLVRAHLDAKCRLCNRQFRSVDELQGHYLTSAMHPHCALCEIGFPDDESCDRHMTTNHPRPSPRIPSPEIRVPSPISLPQPVFPFPQPVTVQPPSSLEKQAATPAMPRPLLNEALSRESAAATIRDDGSEGDDDVTYQTVEASSHVQRAVSEPTVPTGSSIGYGSARGEGDGGWRSPTLSESSEDFPGLRGMARHPQSVSTISLQSAPSSVSGSPRRNGSSIADLPPSPRPTSLTSRTPAVATAPQSESLISQIVSPRIQSPIVSTRSFSSLSEHLARNAAPPVRPSLSRQPTPRVPTPVLSPIRSRSRTTATPAIHSVPRTYSSRKPSVTAVAAPHSSDTEETVPGGNDTPKPKAPSIIKPPKTRAAVWHCRICKEDPCTVPTAAMCGHIFCTPCILQELVKTGACPVCRKMILLRLHVEPE